MRILNPSNHRKAISPVLATVILIAITLIAAIAIAGFVFGLFGSFTSSARVSVSTSTMVHGAGIAAGSSLLLLNSGTSNTNANGVTLTYAGQTCALAVTGGPIQITAGAAPGVTVPVTTGGCATASTASEAFTGSVSLSNGAQVPFSGQFQ